MIFHCYVLIAGGYMPWLKPFTLLPKGRKTVGFVGANHSVQTWHSHIFTERWYHIHWFPTVKPSFSEDFTIEPYRWYSHIFPWKLPFPPGFVHHFLVHLAAKPSTDMSNWFTDKVWDLVAWSLSEFYGIPSRHHRFQLVSIPNMVNFGWFGALGVSPF